MHALTAKSSSEAEQTNEKQLKTQQQGRMTDKVSKVLEVIRRMKY